MSECLGVVSPLFYLVSSSCCLQKRVQLGFLDVLGLLPSEFFRCPRSLTLPGAVGTLPCLSLPALRKARRQRVSSSSLLHGEQVAKGMHAGHLVLGALVPQLVLPWPTSHLPGLEAMCSRLCIANGQVQIQSACSLACGLGTGSDLCDLVIFRSHTLCGCCKESRRCGREAFRGKHRAEAALDKR